MDWWHKGKKDFSKICHFAQLENIKKRKVSYGYFFEKGILEALTFTLYCLSSSIYPHRLFLFSFRRER